MKESYIEDRCRTLAARRGMLLIKLTRMTGWPDRLLVAIDLFPVFVEFKTPGGKLSPAQVVIHKMLLEQGFSVHVIRGVKQFAELLDTLIPDD